MHNSGIYQIICIPNNRSYIGSSKDLYKREQTHFLSLRNNSHYNRELQEDFNRYGKDNFEFRILETCLVENIKQREKETIKMFGTNIYNHKLNPKKTKSKANDNFLLQYDLDGNLIKEWDSIEEIFEQFPDEIEFINLSFQKEILVNKEFIWSSSYIKKIESYVTPQICSYLIYEYDEYKNFVRIWKNISAWRRFYYIHSVDTYNYLNIDIPLKGRTFYTSKQLFQPVKKETVLELPKPLTTSKKIRKFFIELLGGQLA